MKRSPYLVALGALLVLGGVIWTLQGWGVLGGSAATGVPGVPGVPGVTVWAILGPVVTLGGLALLLWPGRRRP